MLVFTVLIRAVTSRNVRAAKQLEATCETNVEYNIGEISGIEAVRKSYPKFFEDIKMIGAKVEIR